MPLRMPKRSALVRKSKQKCERCGSVLHETSDCGITALMAKRNKTLPSLPDSPTAERPWRWMHDKPAAMWYLVNGPVGKETSVIPALEGFDDFGDSPNAKLILKAVNQYDIVRELITVLTRYTRSVEEEYQTLTDGQFGKFNNKPVGQALAKVLVKLLEIHESKG